MRFETDEEDWEEYTYNYSYNEKNQLVLEEYKANVDTVFDIEFIQDSLGNIVTRYVFKSTESNSFNTEYKYDEYDNCIKEKNIQYDGSICRKTYHLQYDEQDNWIKQQEYIDGEPRETQIREIIYFKEIQEN